MAELVTARLRLRPWQEADLEPFAVLNADERVCRYLPSVLTRAESDELAGRAMRFMDQEGWGLWATELRATQTFIGFIGLWRPTFVAPFTPCVEVGWRLSAEVHGQGLATEGARAAVDFGFSTLGLDQIVSFTVPDNLPSRRVMEKLGMTRDPHEDFDHPRLPEGHRLRRHVLYRLWAPNPVEGARRAS